MLSLRETREVGVDGEDCRVELDAVLEEADSHGHRPVAVGLVVVLKEDHGEALLLLQEACQQRKGQQDRGERLEERRAVVKHGLQNKTRP